MSESTPEKKECCEKCFLPSRDVNRGHSVVAVPEDCKDVECVCHSKPSCCEKCRCSYPQYHGGPSTVASYIDNCDKPTCPCHTEKGEHTQPQWAEDLDEIMLKRPFTRDEVKSVVSSLLREIVKEVEALIDANDDGMWSGRETADTIAAIIKKHITPNV